MQINKAERALPVPFPLALPKERVATSSFGGGDVAFFGDFA